MRVETGRNRLGVRVRGEVCVVVVWKKKEQFRKSGGDGEKDG